MGFVFISVFLFLFSTQAFAGDVCGEMILDYSKEMSTLVCHQTAAVVFAVFDGTWEKSVASAEESISVSKLRDEILSSKSAEAWMTTIWQYENGVVSFAPHSFVIDRISGDQYRLWSSYADAYSGGYSLNMWLEDMPWWGWSEFAGNVVLSRDQVEKLFSYLETAQTSTNDQDSRVIADWNVWQPDSLSGFNSSYGYTYAPKYSYEVSSFKTTVPVTAEGCLSHADVVDKMAPFCFENSHVCIKF